MRIFDGSGASCAPAGNRRPNRPRVAAITTSTRTRKAEKADTQSPLQLICGMVSPYMSVLLGWYPKGSELNEPSKMWHPVRRRPAWILYSEASNDADHPAPLPQRGGVTAR